ncbi:MAG: tail fiber domain-containing protein, partial [Bacteroidota bacterium]
MKATSFEGDGSGLTNVGDDLGNHAASQNIQLNNNWLSNDGDNEGIRIDNDGKVGIGEASTGTNLHIQGGGSEVLRVETTSNDRYFSVRPEGGSIDMYNSFFSINRYSDEDVLMAQGGGKVGIGRASAPGALLDIGDGSGDNTVLLKLNTERSWQYEQTGSGANTNLHLKSNNAGKNYNIVSSDGSVIASFRADGGSNNNVGINKIIGTNDNALEVNGNASKSTAGNWLANSDARLKKNIKVLNSAQALEQLLSLQGITYEWN